jgi:hypothetical protein
MNQKKIIQSDWTPPYLHEVKIRSGSKTYTLVKGMEATLTPPRGRKEKQRCEFRYAEVVKSRNVHFTGGGKHPLDFTGVEYGPVEETLMLTFYGPIRSKAARFRTVREGDILTVHIKTEARP